MSNIEVKVEQVIIIDSTIGTGTQENPFRRYREYFTMDGRKLVMGEWEDMV